ncbi:MAG: HNH endonuclease [Roseburia sp.]|nr:HNH endonuclease [Roseburia sp.]
MSKFTVKELWEERYGAKETVTDYAGRQMKKSACGDPNSAYHPTLDHIRPLSKGGEDIKGNIEICHRATNAEKGDTFSTWKANGRTFQAKRVKGRKGEYKIVEIKQ